MKYRFIDLFSGCGGLAEGFLQSGEFVDIAAVEWEKAQVDTLKHRLRTKWGVSNSKDRVLHFDIQREKELFEGWDDPLYGKGLGLDKLVEESGGIDLIIGGPPCQAYSIAGRVRDKNGMRNDYRNFLFEHYLNVVKRYNPKIFLFENVPGMLSASPNGTLISDEVRKGFDGIGYSIVDDLREYALLNAADFGVPQNRRRVIIVGINRDYYPRNIQSLLNKFYTQDLKKYESESIRTVGDAIGDLEAIKPIFDQKKRGTRKAYVVPESKTTWHRPRYHNLRDMRIYELLAKDIETGKNNYASAEALTDLYHKEVGSKSPIHRYKVLKSDEPSTTIIAHLYKDGNRFIHYDSNQARSITPREAARLQSFPDDFDFIGTQTSVFQMIGNAVPPEFARRLAMAVSSLLTKIEEREE